MYQETNICEIAENEVSKILTQLSGKRVKNTYGKHTADDRKLYCIVFTMIAMHSVSKERLRILIVLLYCSALGKHTYCKDSSQADFKTAS